MKFLHSMIRVLDLDKSLNFYQNALGLMITRRNDYPKGKFSLIYLATKVGEPEIELTYNWDQKEKYSNGKNFGHLAFLVDDIYKTCQKMIDLDIEISRPPRDGYLAFIKCPDGISIEFLQKDGPLKPCSPWTEMPNIGDW
ncbi:MAG: lactoylglutathione lyase [Candidatus Cloacimonadota bacterium]|nr:MAG: lactoylglutathione lyase [Candidatus Cloacimonadota bacterium]